MTEPILPKGIFNTEKTDYENPEIILGQEPGMFDTINKKYPDLWELYKMMKNQDWDENEFDYSPANAQFKSCDRSTYDMMVKTLAWQWEADTVASRVFISVLGGVCTSDEAWAGWQRISDNECVHSATYSEIVRNSFDDPNEILDELLAIREAMSRLVTVGAIFNEAKQYSAEYVTGARGNDQELYNKIYLFIVAILHMERIQFMASFAITFGLVNSTGLFQPIGKAIQKICQDEFEVHVQFGKAVLSHLHKTDRGRQAYKDTRETIIKLNNEVTESELVWTDYLFSEGRELTGITADMIKDWIKFGSTDVAQFLAIKEEELNYNFITENPLKYMEAWIDLSKVQVSNQEEDTGAYKVGLLQRDDEDTSFDFDL